MASGFGIDYRIAKIAFEKDRKKSDYISNPTKISECIAKIFDKESSVPDIIENKPRKKWLKGELKKGKRGDYVKYIMRYEIYHSELMYRLRGLLSLTDIGCHKLSTVPEEALMDGELYLLESSELCHSMDKFMEFCNYVKNYCKNKNLEIDNNGWNNIVQYYKIKSYPKYVFNKYD